MLFRSEAQARKLLETQNREKQGRHTWVTRMTICADVVPRHRMYELLEDFFVARLLALAHSCRHDPAKVTAPKRVTVLPTTAAAENRSVEVAPTRDAERQGR